MAHCAQVPRRPLLGRQRPSRHWVRNLSAARDAAIREAGSEIERIWRLYMTGSASAFASGEISVFQTLTVHRGDQP